MAKATRTEPCPRCRERGADRRGDNLVCYSDGGKHCFSCGYHEGSKLFTKHVNEEKRTENQAILPYDFTREIPARAWQWLLQYGLSWSYWQKAGCGYSPSQERLIFCVGQPLDFALGRDCSVALPDSKPRAKWFSYGDCHRRAHVFGSYEDARCVVCVEDLISAHKVTAANNCCVPIFGTQVLDCHIKTLRYIGLPIVMWLDADQKAAAAKRGHRLSVLTGLPVRNVFTDNDPKLLSFKEISEVLNDV